MKRWKKVLLGLLAALLVVVAILMFNTFRFESKQIQAEAIAPISIPENCVDHFSQALKFKTVSTDKEEDFDSTEFEGFARFLEETYPLCDSLLDKKTFNSYSFLYQWPGTDPDLKPILFIAHLDVVPVIEQNLPDWRQDPFAGKIVKDTVWGRGALDDKNVVISIMESLEHLLGQGFHPQRGISVALTHDEEIGGEMGAAAIAAYLRKQSFEADFILDEGGVITQGILPDLGPDLALIGVAEKGFLTLDLKTKIEGGHSSIPNEETAIDVLAKAIVALKTNPFPAKISPAIASFIDYVGPELPFTKKLVFANSALLSSAIINVYEKKSSSNALVRTTIAPSLFHAGVKENVVPQVATASVNFRILSGESIASVTERVINTIDDERITVTQRRFRSEPSAVSSYQASGFQTLQRTLAETNPELLVSPYLTVALTDSRHFSDLTSSIYRFSPIKINSKNLKSFHGLNENLAVIDFENSIRFYIQLIRNCTKEQAGS